MQIIALVLEQPHVKDSCEEAASVTGFTQAISLSLFTYNSKTFLELLSHVSSLRMHLGYSSKFGSTIPVIFITEGKQREVIQNENDEAGKEP